MAYVRLVKAASILALFVVLASFSCMPSLAETISIYGVSDDGIVIVDGDNVTAYNYKDIGIYPADIVANADGSKLFIIDREGRCIKVFDMRQKKVIDSFEIGGVPLCIEHDAVSGRLFVAEASQASWKGQYTTDTFCEPFPQIMTLPFLYLDYFFRLITGQRPRPIDFDGVTVLNPDTGAVIDEIDVWGVPGGMEISPDGRFLYVLSCPPGYTVSSGSSMTIIDLSNNEIERNIFVDRKFGNTYAGVTVSPDLQKIYVSDLKMFNGSVLAVDLKDDHNTTSIGIAGEPGAIAVSPDGARVYVTYMNHLNGTYSPGIVAVIDSSNDTIRQNITVGTMPSDIHISPDGKYVYVAHRSMTNIDKGGLTIIDAADGRVISYVGLDHIVDNFILYPDSPI